MVRRCRRCTVGARGLRSGSRGSGLCFWRRSVWFGEEGGGREGVRNVREMEALRVRCSTAGCHPLLTGKKVLRNEGMTVRPLTSGGS